MSLGATVTASGRRLLLVSPRPPRVDGQGDQRRASQIVEALSGDWDVEVISWLPDIATTGLARWVDRPITLLRVLALSFLQPLQVAYVQAWLPKAQKHRIVNSRYERVVFVTTRSVPRSMKDGFIVDFIDDLGGAALRRGHSSVGVKSWFWLWEGDRLRALDRRTSKRARLAIACSSADAAGIAASVSVVPLAATTKPMADEGDKVLFFGNLFYAPNREASTWVCEKLVPCLSDLGVAPSRVVIAGRRPTPALRKRAKAAGIDLRADVVNLSEVLRDAAVVVAPMQVESGPQSKILDAVGASRACVITSVANIALGLIDGQSALVREREPARFARAVVTLLNDRPLRDQLTRNARSQLSNFMPQAVTAAWRSAVR